MNKKHFIFTLVFIIFQLTANAIGINAEETSLYKVESKQVAITISDRGEIAGVALGAKKVERAIQGFTHIEGCVVKDVDVAVFSDDGMKITKTLFHEEGKHTLTLTEQFVPTATSVRWEIKIKDDGKPWSAPIQTQLQYPITKNVKFWTSWADPRHAVAGRMDNKQLVEVGIEPVVPSNSWSDPLVPLPISNTTFWYGAAAYKYENPRVPYSPLYNGGHEVFCMPLATLIEEDTDSGLSLVLSLEDLLLDISLTTTEDGQLTFSRLNHRLGEGKEICFAMDLVPHQADWRAVLGWTVQRYSEFFNPPNPKAHQIAGTGAYSSYWTDFDAEKMKAMAFMVNWKASFDFPYMGMFLPPVEGNDVAWQRYGGGMVTFSQMRDYSRKMRDRGFHVLNYFNVTEFGAKVKYPPPRRKAESEADLWKDPNDFLYSKLPNAYLLCPVFENGKNPRGDMYYTWGGAVVMDCGDPDYQKFLLEQVQRHIEKLPESSGLCIDRVDWLRLYNHRADDGVSWFGDLPVRSLYVSWCDLMSKLGPIVHQADKVVYCNNHIKRIEHLRHIDGIFDEFAYGNASAVNSIAILGLRKPVIGWTKGRENLEQPNPDSFFQKYLYLGVFPMCPFPGNDHSILPDEWVDKQYIDYVPLMVAMRGKKWVLEPHVIHVPDAKAKANIFEVPDGFIVPVVYAENDENVKVVLQSKTLFHDKFTISAIHPGSDIPVAVKVLKSHNQLILDIPVKRGCAMVRMLRQ